MNIGHLSCKLGLSCLGPCFTSAKLTWVRFVFDQVALYSPQEDN